MAGAGRTERGAARVLDKLEASVRAGQYYEAHQMYRTLYFRYLGQKKYTELLTLLSKGSLLLLESDQQGSGADLGILLIDVLVKSDTKPNEEWIEKLAKLFETMSPNIPERDTFLTNAVKWTMDEKKRGHPLLHKRFAEVYWKEKKYSIAHSHFLNSSDGVTYANYLIELHTTRGLKSEIDLFIAQAVLRILCLRNVAMANETFNSYTGQHPLIKNTEGPPYLFPLLNFIWFLLRAVEEQKTSVFKVLRARYSVTIKRDPDYNYYLDNIGHIWFGLENPQQSNNVNNTFFGGLLKSIIGDGESSGDEAEVRPSTSNTSRTGTQPDLD